MDWSKIGISQVLFLCCYLNFFKFGETIDSSHFNGLQELENTRVSHTLHRRVRRQSVYNTDNAPDVIHTDITGANHHLALTFQRNFKRKLSPLYYVDDNKGRFVERKSSNCTHFYVDVGNNAHAVVDRCNSTDRVTMLAEVVFNSELFIILPKQSDDANVAHQHGFYKVMSSTNYGNDYVETSNVPKENRLPNVNHRLRRGTVSDRAFVELMFVVDYSLYTFWYALTTGTESARKAAALDKINWFYTYVSQGMDSRFKGLESENGLKLDIVLTSIHVLSTAAASAITETVTVTTSTPRGAIDAKTLLDDFNAWVDTEKTNDANFPNADHVMLLTARDIVKDGQTEAAGLAYLGTICTDKARSIVEDQFNFQSPVTAAHELGHSLNGRHDSLVAGCSDADGYILSSTNGIFTDSKAKHPWKFSICSASAFSAKMTSLSATSSNCLNTDDTTPVLPTTGTVPGQEYPPDEQCKLMTNDSTSSLWRINHWGAFDKICTAMACTKNSNTQLTYVIPLDGTTCGNKKWCWNGDCVTSDNAPATDAACVFGDQVGEISSGTTCASIVAGTLWKCYTESTVQACCDWCPARASSISGCEYGDRNDCSNTIASQCYGSTVRTISCCQTCYDYKQNYAHLPAGCDYGDSLGGCVNTVSVCNQYPSQCCSTCSDVTTTKAATTKPATTTPSAGQTTTAESGTTAAKTTQKPTTLTLDSLPDWVIPAAAGIGGFVGLGIILGLLASCMKSSNKPKYSEGHRRGHNRSRSDAYNRRYLDHYDKPRDAYRSSNNGRYWPGGEHGGHPNAGFRRY